MSQPLASLEAANLPVTRPRASLGWARTSADYISLAKPRIVLLLVVTELGALVAAGRGHVPLNLAFVAVVGGALSAGGAAAVNCWFDRDLDRSMERTCQRPLPAGRIPAGRGLAFGALLGAAGFLVLALGANLLAALLALAGGLFYAVAYTMWLKRATSQNIVIGGAAGAVPPLVGWAVATHGLAPLAWVLFLIVFCWTPPHFWALSLLLRRQYARAGVPMLPVVHGEVATRRAILAYSGLLAGVSILPTIWLGFAYLAATATLDLALICLAVGALRDHGHRLAALLFHYSILYLGLVFVCVALTATFAAS